MRSVAIIGPVSALCWHEKTGKIIKGIGNRIVFGENSFITSLNCTINQLACNDNYIVAGGTLGAVLFDISTSSCLEIFHGCVGRLEMTETSLDVACLNGSVHHCELGVLELSFTLTRPPTSRTAYSINGDMEIGPSRRAGLIGAVTRVQGDFICTDAGCLYQGDDLLQHHSARCWDMTIIDSEPLCVTSTGSLLTRQGALPFSKAPLRCLAASLTGEIFAAGDDGTVKRVFNHPPAYWTDSIDEHTSPIIERTGTKPDGIKTHMPPSRTHTIHRSEAGDIAFCKKSAILLGKNGFRTVRAVFAPQPGLTLYDAVMIQTRIVLLWGPNRKKDALDGLWKICESSGRTLCSIRGKL